MPEVFLLKNRYIYHMNTLAHHSNSRNIFMDCLKGYAIYLVVLGHAIQTFDTDWKTNPLSIAIYMFHMPLFIAISGYFSYSSITHTRFRILLKRRFVQIMVPSLTMGIINVLLIWGGVSLCVINQWTFCTLSICCLQECGS